MVHTRELLDMLQSGQVAILQLTSMTSADGLWGNKVLGSYPRYLQQELDSHSAYMLVMSTNGGNVPKYNYIGQKTKYFQGFFYNNKCLQNRI